MQKNVILINLPPAQDYNYDSSGTVYPSTAILIIGTILKNQGLKVIIVDGTIIPDFREKTLGYIDDNTIFIGFSVMTSQVPMALDMSESIKAGYPEIPVIWGGIHPTLFPEQTLRNPNINIIVTGEGSETVLSLIDYFNKKTDLQKVKGIGFKKHTGEIVITEPGEPDNINTLPHIDCDILDDIGLYLEAKSVWNRELASKKNEKLRVIPILTGLGCCYQCQFCINVFLKRKYRYRSAQSIINEIKKLQEKYKANAFIFYDEDFLINKKRLNEFLSLIEKENLKFYWRIWARANYFREDYLNHDLIIRLERNGLRSIVMGAESGSQRILDSIKKGIKVEEILYSAKMLEGTDITPRYSFIVGFEGESREDTKKTYKLCADLININKKVDIAGPFIFRHYPGSPIFNNIIRNYNLAIPREIGEWRDALSNEGYLKIEKMPWLWAGFTEFATTLNKEMIIYARLKNINNFISILVKRLIKWRVKNLYTKFPVELYAYFLLRQLYNKYKFSRLKSLLRFNWVLKDE